MADRERAVDVMVSTYGKRGLARMALDLGDERGRLLRANERLATTLAHVINRVSTEGRDDEHGHIFTTGKAAIEWAQSGLAAPSEERS